MLYRTYPRSNRHYITWPAWSRNEPCQLCALAELKGIQGIHGGGDLVVLPSLVLSRGGGPRDGSDPSSFESGSVRMQPSLGLKYGLDREWTAEATLNPDFSQVESDAAQVDVNTTFALFFPDQRRLPGPGDARRRAVQRLHRALTHQLPVQPGALNLRVIVEHDEFSDRMAVEPLLVYQINPFTIFYVGSTHGYSRFDEEGFVRTERQLFAKFQYLFG